MDQEGKLVPHEMSSLNKYPNKVNSNAFAEH